MSKDQGKGEESLNQLLGEMDVDGSDQDAPANREVWQNICPGLRCSHDRTASKKDYVAFPKITPSQAKRRRERLRTHGFVLVDDHMDPRWVQMLSKGIQQLHEKHIPAPFILLFDETWLLATQSAHILQTASHPRNQFNFDTLAWYIPVGMGGFSPHRDRQPPDSKTSFHDTTGDAKFLTHWIALSDATPENSCLYVIPKPFDPGYTAGDTEDQDPLQRALPDKQSYQHIRALPRERGQSVLFTHRIIHWGSQGGYAGDNNDDDIDVNDRANTIEPRVAISFVCSDPDFEPRLLANYGKEEFDGEIEPSFRLPPFHIRLVLVCAQLLIYYQRLELDKTTILFCHDVVTKYKHELETSFFEKVMVEFVKAMKELQQQERKGDTSMSTEKSNDPTGEADLDGEEAMMEEMLNAEAGGYGEFEDDYDEEMEEELHAEEQRKLDAEDEEEEKMAEQGGGQEGENLDTILQSKRALSEAEAPKEQEGDNQASSKKKKKSKAEFT